MQSPYCPLLSRDSEHFDNCPIEGNSFATFLLYAYYKVTNLANLKKNLDI